MAESAGKEMTASQDSTSQLVEAVREIALTTQQQAKISNDLRERAGGIVARTKDTTQELVEQLAQTKNLVQYARMLVQSVRVFKLPSELAN